MGGAVTEEKAISCMQYLDLVYSQSGTLYDLIPQAPIDHVHVGKNCLADESETYKALFT